MANPYFIKQFCTVGEGAACKLDPKYVGGFTGVQSVGQIIGMLVSLPYLDWSHIGTAAVN